MENSLRKAYNSVQKKNLFLARGFSELSLQIVSMHVFIRLCFCKPSIYLNVCNNMGKIYLTALSTYM